MAKCDVCGKEENMPYHCRHCGGTHCAEHRLPESHNCPGLQNWNDPGGVFDSGFDDSVNEPRSTRSTRLSGTGGLLSYFRGNATFLFLGLMVAMYVVQFVIAPLLGVGKGTPLWYSLFTLSTDNPLYVWTWFTSVFAHGSFTHILFNGIVLFFFGPIVERRIGTKRFVALFFVSGIVAGLAQVGLGLLLSDLTRVLGASGAIMAIMGVLTVLNPDLRVLLYFFIPVPIWILTLGYAAISVFGVIAPGLNVLGNVAHAAHLAGLLIGLAYGQRVKGQGVSAPGQLQLGGPGRGPGRGPF